MPKDTSLKMIDNGQIESVDIILDLIKAKHKKVSAIVTPKPYIKKKMDLDYVEFGYMREIADREYPGWSWTVIDSENLGSEAYMVHGRLKWYDSGIWREGDTVAAHRVQKKRGTSNEFVDIGNDIKAANTDAIKKAFNMYMNIADDVYRNQIEDTNLTTKQEDALMEVALLAGLGTKINNQLRNGEIHGLNYEGSIAKLTRLAERNQNETDSSSK